MYGKSLLDLENSNNNQQDWFLSIPNEKNHSDFLKKVFQILLHKAVFQGTDRSEPVTIWKDPNNLHKDIRFDLPELPESEESLLKAIKDTVHYSVKTGHPYFVNQLFSGLDPYGFAGQLVTDALNSSVYTYEVAPVFTLMEKSVLHKMRSLIGWSTGDGIFCPGGSLANGIGINLARFSCDENIKKTGICGFPRLVIFTSEDAHYSLRKMASLLGLGEDNVVLIPTDETGSMDVIHLESSISHSLREGAMPFAVVATAGTTVLGAFDSLSSIADVCRANNLWLHVDAAWGGGLLFSKSYRNKLNSIEKADSVTMNPHKLLAVPQQCSLLLTKHEGILSECHATHASYLFQPDKFYGAELDFGDSHIQCGRRPDVFKFWLMWKAKGTTGFSCHVDTIMETSQYLRDIVKERPSFELVCEPQFVNVCFWFIPPSLRDTPQSERKSSEFNEKLHKIAPVIKERMIRKGSLMLGYQPLGDRPNFFRFVTQNSALTREDVIYILDEIELLGADL